jgi:prolipoprotein diacylglyceryltransferase
MQLLSINWNVDPVMLSLGPFSIRYYAICWVLCFVVCYIIFRKIFKKENFENGMTLNMGQWLSLPFVIGGIIILVYYFKKSLKPHK